MIARLPFAIGAAIALALMLSLALAAMKPARPPMIQTQGMPFHERWQEPPIMPRAVRTIQITPRAKPPPKPVVAQVPAVVKEVPLPVKAKAKPKREREAGDVCRGRGKSYRNGKRSWRCKRS